jgi:hypothetical protein
VDETRACRTNGGGGKRNAYGLFIGNPEGKRQLRKPRLRLMDNIKMDLVEIRWYGVDWIGLAKYT